MSTAWPPVAEVSEAIQDRFRFLTETGFAAPILTQWSDREVTLTYRRAGAVVEFLYEPGSGFGGRVECSQPGPGLGHQALRDLLTGAGGADDSRALQKDPARWREFLDRLVPAVRQWATALKGGRT